MEIKNSVTNLKSTPRTSANFGAGTGTGTPGSNIMLLDIVIALGASGSAFGSSFALEVPIHTKITKEQINVSFIRAPRALSSLPAFWPALE